MSINFDRIHEAIEMACEAHRGQTDQGLEPYIWHVLRVGTALWPDEEAMIVGFLHDAFEDGKVTQHQISARFGTVVGWAVALLSHHKHVPYHCYISAIGCEELTRKVKLADLSDNLDPRRLALAALHGADVARLVRKYTRAVATLEGVEL